MPAEEMFGGFYDPQIRPVIVWGQMRCCSVTFASRNTFPPRLRGTHSAFCETLVPPPTHGLDDVSRTGADADNGAVVSNSVTGVSDTAAVAAVVEEETLQVNEGTLEVAVVEQRVNSVA